MQARRARTQLISRNSTTPHRSAHGHRASIDRTVEAASAPADRGGRNTARSLRQRQNRSCPGARPRQHRKIAHVAQVHAVEHDVLEGRTLIPQKDRDAIVDGLGLGNESLLPGIRGKKPERRIRGFASEFFIGLERPGAFCGKAHLPRHEEEGTGSRRHRVRGNRVGHAGHADRALLHELLGARMRLSRGRYGVLLVIVCSTKARRRMEANSSSPTPARTMSSAIGPRNGLPGDPMRRERALNILLPFIAVIAFLVLWSAGVRVFEIPDYLLPAPEDVIRRIARDWYVLARNASYTVQSVLSGFAAAVLVGVPLAFAVVLSRSVERVTMPFLVMSQTIPKVAIAPILVVWLGFGILPKIAIVFLIAFFPIVVSTVVGLKSVESDMIDLVRSMGARTLKIMLR